MLRGSMKGGDQCREFVFGHILQLIDEHGQRGTAIAGSFSGSLKQRLEIVLKISVIGQPRLRLVVDSNLDIVVLHF